jgi:hypothetical protein
LPVCATVQVDVVPEPDAPVEAAIDTAIAITGGAQRSLRVRPNVTSGNLLMADSTKR